MKSDEIGYLAEQYDIVYPLQNTKRLAGIITAAVILFLVALVS